MHRRRQAQIDAQRVTAAIEGLTVWQSCPEIEATVPRNLVEVAKLARQSIVNSASSLQDSQ